MNKEQKTAILEALDEVAGGAMKILKGPQLERIADDLIDRIEELGEKKMIKNYPLHTLVAELAERIGIDCAVEIGGVRVQVSKVRDYPGEIRSTTVKAKFHTPIPDGGFIQAEGDDGRLSPYPVRVVRDNPQA